MKFEFDSSSPNSISFLVVPNGHSEDAVVALCTVGRGESLMNFLDEMNAILEDTQNRMDDTEDYFGDVVENAVMEVTEKYHGTCSFVYPECNYNIWY